MSAEFDKLRLAIKEQLQKDNSNMKEEELMSKSLAIATSRAAKLGIRSSEKIDTNGEIIVAENIKVILNSNITSVGNIITE